LSNPEVESHLIINVVQDCYIALAKGGLVPHHLLIVPVLHHINSRQVELMEDKTISPVLQSEINKIKSAVANAELKNDNVVVAYEVFGGGDELELATRLHHMHIQVETIHVACTSTRGFRRKGAGRVQGRSDQGRIGLGGIVARDKISCILSISSGWKGAYHSGSSSANQWNPSAIQYSDSQACLGQSTWSPRT
jgi:hypothetical protein